MQAKALDERLAEASMLLDEILEYMGETRTDPKMEDYGQDVYEAVENFLDEEYYQKMQGVKK